MQTVPPPLARFEVFANVSTPSSEEHHTGRVWRKAFTAALLTVASLGGGNCMGPPALGDVEKNILHHLGLSTAR